MKRVVRVQSSEFLKVPGDTLSSSPETNFRELDDVFLQTQTKIWLGEVLHIRFNEETNVADLLADGELLFQVSKVVWKLLLKQNVELKHSNVHIYERTSSGKIDGRYMPYPKVDSFLKICQIMGLKGIDLFTPTDVVEKGDVRRVCMCIRSFSKKALSMHLNVPDFDICTYTIAMPTDLVGGIRRYLEQRQNKYASSNGCNSPSNESKELHQQEAEDCKKELTSNLQPMRTKQNKVMKSIAGAVTLLGAIFFVHHVRQKKEKEKNTKSNMLFSGQGAIMKVAEIGKKANEISGQKIYPGERLQF